MRSIYRNMSLVLTGALLPLLLAVPSVLADPDTDACAGGIDAGDSLSQATPLQVLAGCQGKLYHGGQNSSFASDWVDVHSIRVEGSGTAKLDYRLCNLNTVGYVQYEIWFYSDIFYPKRLVADYLPAGHCSSEHPQTYEGFYKPGEWRLVVHTNEYLVPPNMTMSYDMYAQPLWR